LNRRWFESVNSQEIDPCPGQANIWLEVTCLGSNNEHAAVYLSLGGTNNATVRLHLLYHL